MFWRRTEDAAVRIARQERSILIYRFQKHEGIALLQTDTRTGRDMAVHQHVRKPARAGCSMVKKNFTVRPRALCRAL